MGHTPCLRDLPAEQVLLEWRHGFDHRGPTGLETEIRRTVGLARARRVSDLIGEDGRVRQP